MFTNGDLTRRSSMTRSRGSAANAASPHTRRAQLVLLAIIAGFVISSMPGIGPRQGSSSWLWAVLQPMAYAAAALLCLIRTPADQNVRRLVAIGVVLFGLSTLDRDEWLVRTVDPLTVSVLSHLLRGTFYICIVVSVLLLIRKRVRRLPLTRAFDGIVVALGAATIAALSAPALGGFAQSASTRARPVADLLLLALVLGVVSLFRAPPPSSLWVLVAALMLIGLADWIDATRAVQGSFEAGAVVNATCVVAATALALAPGWDTHSRITRVSPALFAQAAPMIAAVAAITVMVTANFVHISPVVRVLAVATLSAALCRQVTAFSEARRAGEQAALAQTDELTGLLNRRGLYNQAAPILSGDGSNESGRPTCALLLLDLDHFKDINDSLGHAAGDELLRRVAACLCASLREEDIVARLGGDEFALVLPGGAIDQAVKIAVALTTALERTVRLDGVPVRTGASIGIALGPEHGRDLGTLLRHADIAMYRAKQDRAGYLVYTHRADDRVAAPCGAELLTQLRHAIAHGEVIVHYQPKVCMTTGDIVGVEALVRWHHPERGLLYPDEFLPQTRHSALMCAMTELVVRRALDDAAVWHARGHRVPVSVNLFPPTVADLDLPARLDDTLRRKGLRPEALAVEITEDFLLADPDRARHVLDGLHRLGIAIAIDDFGSGSASLGDFSQIPVDEVKLDRSLCTSIAENPRVAQTVRSMIDVSRTLGLTTVAEGVETRASAAILTGYGCDIAQGHYYCQPLTASQTLNLLATVANANSRGQRQRQPVGADTGTQTGERHSVPARFAGAAKTLAQESYVGYARAIVRQFARIRSAATRRLPARRRPHGSAR